MSTPTSNLDGAFPSVGEPASRRARRRRARRLASIGVIAVLLAGGTLAVRRTSGSDNAGYRVATVGTHDVDAVLSGVATIEPVSQATVAFPVAGTVASVAVQPGEKVTAGQQLASLDTNDLAQTLRQKLEALAQAQLVLSKALAGEDVSSLTGGSARTASFSAGAEPEPQRLGHHVGEVPGEIQSQQGPGLFQALEPVMPTRADQVLKPRTVTLAAPP